MHVNWVLLQGLYMSLTDSNCSRSIYNSVSFSQVTNSLGAQLTACRANLTAQSSLPFERRKSHCACSREYDCGVCFIAADMICTALTSSSEPRSEPPRYIQVNSRGLTHANVTLR